MEEMLSYVFNGIQRNDTSIRTIKRSIRQQNRINMRIVFLLGWMLYIMRNDKKRQNAKMKILANEIDRLKEEQNKGE